VTIAIVVRDDVVVSADGDELQQALLNVVHNAAQACDAGGRVDVTCRRAGTWAVVEVDIQATRRHVPDAENKIAFDRFHVAGTLGKAVDLVRREEHRELLQEGDLRLTGTKYQWLRSDDGNSDERWRQRFAALKTSTLRTARAWAIKQAAAGLWRYTVRGWAVKAWNRWLGWAQRSRLKPVLNAARTIRRHLWGILNAVVLDTTNAKSESTNAAIQRIKRMACGFRNRERFRNAIYFHLGGLDLYPALPDATHTDS
jgi:transposase